MLLVAHIILALGGLSSMLAASLAKLQGWPGHYKLAKLAGFSFIGLVITGAELVMSNHGQVTSACQAGLVYLGCLMTLYLIYRQVATKN